MSGVPSAEVQQLQTRLAIYHTLLLMQRTVTLILSDMPVADELAAQSQRPGVLTADANTLRAAAQGAAIMSASGESAAKSNAAAMNVKNELMNLAKLGMRLNGVLGIGQGDAQKPGPKLAAG